MERLGAISPELVDKLRRVPRARQRAVALLACEFAIGRTSVTHPLVEEVLQQLRAGELPDAVKRAEVEQLTGQLDEKYLDLQEAAEESGVGADDYLRVFAQARAIAALSFAGNPNTFEASTEAIYEAAAAAGDKKQELLGLVETALSTTPD